MAILKVGPVQISFAENGRKKSPSSNEIGAPGTIFLSGQLTEEEYNHDLRGSKARVVYDKMRRSDGQVKATLLVCELPIRSASWAVEPASDDQTDTDIAQFIEDNLFEGMTITWDNFLHHTLLMLPFGFSIFEKVYQIIDSQVKWRKMAPRLPKTLHKWLLDPKDAGLAGIEQLVFKDDTYQFITIPAEKLLVFTHEKEGSNFEGISLLRAAYKHWYYKDHLYRLDGIAAERHATGVPYFSHPPDATAEEKTRLDDIAQHLYAHELQYVRMSNDYEFDIKGLTGRTKELGPSIEHHDKMIARSILAQFLNLGSTDVGSFALARDQSSFFLMALKSVGKNVCDTMNRFAIPQLVDYNWPGITAYPKLKVSGLETKAMKDYAEAIVSLVTAGALTMDDGVQATIRDMLDLPEKAVEEPNPVAGPVEEDRERERITLKEGRWRRELTLAEGFVSFEEIEGVLDKAEQKFVQATKEIQDRQIDTVVALAIKAIEKKDLKKLNSLDVTYRTEMANQMMTVLSDIFKYGRLQVKKELQAQKHMELAEAPGPLDPADEELALEFIKARSRASSTVLANKMRQSAIFQGLKQIKQGAADKEALALALKSLSDRELVASAQFSINEAFNFGRGVEAEQAKDEIDRVQYSALMDPGTCEICLPLDGDEWEYDDVRTAKYQSGNPECLGGTKCRCVLVYISTAETPSVR